MFLSAGRLLAGGGGRLIAAYRVMLALLLLVMGTTGPDLPGLHAGADDFYFLAYAVVSVGLLAIALRSWWLDYALLPFSYALDWLGFLVAPLLVAPATSGYTAAVIAFGAFILIETHLRWGWPVLGRVAILLNMCCWITCLLMEAAHDHLQTGEALRRIVSLGLVSLAIVWVGRRGTEPALPAMVPQLPADRDAALGHGLRFALEMTGATGGALCWSNLEGSDCMTRSSGLASGQCGARGCGACLTPYDQTAVARLFDLRSHRALKLDRSGRIVSLHGRIAEEDVLDGLGLTAGLYMPLEGMTGKGGLLLTGIGTLDWSHLALGGQLAGKVSRGIDDYHNAMIAQETAVLGLRKSIARDLHDSIAQSLAGAKFWLKSYGNKLEPGSPQAVEIDRIKSALTVEHAKLREMIERLRDDEPVAHNSDLASDIEGLAELLSVHWRTDVKVDAPIARIVVPAGLSFEVQQMVREAVSNAVRHGGASSIHVNLRRKADRLLAEITDNGDGFPKDALWRPISLHERTLALGGILQVLSEPGRTKLEFNLPLMEQT